MSINTNHCSSVEIMTGQCEPENPQNNQNNNTTQQAVPPSKQNGVNVVAIVIGSAVIIIPLIIGILYIRFLYNNGAPKKS